MSGKEGGIIRNTLVALLANLLGEFYACQLPYFPVVEADSSPGKGEGKKLKGGSPPPSLAGFLTRKSLNLWASDMERLGHNYKHIPKNILSDSVGARELLKLLPSGQSVPVFNTKGAKIAFWTEKQLIQALGQLPEQEKTKADLYAEDPGPKKIQAIPVREESQKQAPFSHKSENSLWLANLLLEAFPWPLYACDLQGKSLFFNHFFEKRVLKKAKLKNSIKRAEKYFIEIVRDLLAQSFMEDPQRRQSHKILSLYDKFLSQHIYIVNIEERGHVHGYFFVFQEGEDPGFTAEIKRHLSSGSSLDEIMDEIEGNIIFKALGDKGRNISHTAKALGVKRSTLQNKISRLKIEKRFGYIQERPIRRQTLSKKEKINEEKDDLPKEAMDTDQKRSQGLSQRKEKTLSKVVDKKKNTKKNRPSSNSSPKSKRTVPKKAKKNKILSPLRKKTEDDDKLQKPPELKKAQEDIHSPKKEET